MGDPSGIGPEIVVKTLAHEEVYRACRPIVFADASVMEQAIEIAGVPLLLRRVKEPGEARFKHGTLEILDVPYPGQDAAALTQESPESAKAAVQCLSRAVEMALNRALHGVAAGPIAGKGLRAAGHKEPNQAELVGELARSGRRTMMLMAGSLRVASATGCMTVSRALSQINRSRVFAAIRLSHQTLQRLGVKKPRIGVAALNPCADEREPAEEEAREIVPAIDDSKQDRIEVEGPLATQELLSKLADGHFDAGVVMYHDQGFPAAKALSTRLAGAGKSQPAVIVIMGLPTTCVVVDHDPEFESAGKGVAGEDSLLMAVQVAARLAAGS